MNQKTNFGYKLLLCIIAFGALVHTGARGFRFPFDYDPDPQPDTPATADSPKLIFPIYDNPGDPLNVQTPSSLDLNDPSNVEKSVEYDPESNRYYISEKIGDQFYRNPTYMSLDEYLKYQGQKDEQAYWKRRMDALTLFNKKPSLPTMYKEGIFDRIFGGTSIQVRPQGNVDVTIGGNWQNIKNPTLVQRAQKYGVFDFDMQMNINLLATIGDKMKLNISNNTKATFDYQNMQKLEYTGKEDEIIKKIEAGNVSFPLNSGLISGVQSLFGIKTQLQFGKLWITAALSQQKSKRQSLTIQGGSQTQTFGIKADEYEENKHFLLSQYFRDNYNQTLKTFPLLNSLVNIIRIEVWVTNRTGAVNGVRDIIGFMDLGEKDPYNPSLVGSSVGSNVPSDNRSNLLYNRLLERPEARTNPTSTLVGSLGLQQGIDFEKATARKLNPSEYSFNPQLGYISLNTTLNPDDILAVAFRYTFNGRTYQVGEFAEDLPPDSTNTKAMFMKLLKGTSARPTLPIWDLMMKNVYALGGLGISKEDFRLNVLYQNPGGGEIRYLPEGPSKGVQLLTLLNLDRLNFQNDPQPDGIFDFVDGITINTQQGKIMFPVLEPFGKDLQFAFGGNPQYERKYLYAILYDSTKTIARQFQQNNRYVIRGTYKSASSSEIFLGGFNIPQGSVSVTAGGQKLVEGADYQIDYGIGRLKILNMGILNSGIPINVQYEDNATFGFQQQNFMGARLDYFMNDKLAIGGTFMRLTERPFTQKTSFGEDPIKNTVVGLDANYQSESPGLTRLLDKLPVYSTTASSFITASGEVAGLFPGHPKQINTLDPEGAVYIDDFEGTRSGIDLRLPAQSWSLSSVPVNAMDRNGNELFPEGKLIDNLAYGKNRARLAWYTIEPSLVDAVGGIPDFVKKDPNQHYVRLVEQQQVFPARSLQALQNNLTTFDLAYYPRERGPYNFDSSLNNDGSLPNPMDRWGGIQRAIDYSDFEQSNVEFIEFWVMDPFIYNNSSPGGQLYINLGNVSEDVMKDSRKFFENGIPYPKDLNKLQSSVWGFTPTLQTQIVRAFDNDEAARAVQDVGYDGLQDEEEKQKFASFLNNISVSPGVRAEIEADPASDNYRYFRSAEFDQANAGILERYKKFNNPHGNSPVVGASQTYSNAATNIPESEDINRDNTLNESEDYFQYRIDFSPNQMQVGSNYIVDKVVARNVKLPNGAYEDETWYQFKIPIREGQRIGNISDFRSIRFMRMFLTGFEDSVILRFARLELGRNQWRRYQFSLKNPGEVIPDEDQKNTEFSVTSVSVEENSGREPVPYVIPPGVDRQQAQVSNGSNIQLNEQALALQVCNLQDGDARAVFKEVGVDMRQFGKLKMFIHAETPVNQAPLKDGDVYAVIRLGSDFISNYYEYQIPLKISPKGINTNLGVWPEENNVDLVLDELVNVKTERNAQGIPAYIPYAKTDQRGNTIVVVGSPNLGDAKTILLGIMNPKKTTKTPADDGLPKCAEVWFNELRMTGLNEKPGYAATGRVNLQLADLGTVKLSGSMHTQGYGNIDQKLNQRLRDNFYQYDVSTNLNIGKLMPRKWGVQLPLFIGYSQSVSNPQYDPYDLDVKYEDALSAARDKAQRDSLKKVAQDFTSITSVNLSNVRILGNPDKQSGQPKPWSVKNFDLSYAYNKQFKRNPLIEGDALTNHKLNLGYTYNIRSKPIEPFKRVIKSRSKWLSLIKDFNFNLLPANFTFRTELNKVMDETKVRSIGEGAVDMPATYYKNFTWMRDYNLRWELTRSLSFDYHATNQSRIDEPYGRINTQEKRDTLWERIGTFGRNTAFSQTFATSYKVPLQKLPITDWTSLNVTYNASYNYTAASQLARSLGNTIGNTQGIQANGELDFRALYNKQRWLRAVNQPKPRQPKNTKSNKIGAAQNLQKTDGVSKVEKTKDGEGINVSRNDGNKLSPNGGNDRDAGKAEDEDAAKKDEDAAHEKNDSTNKTAPVLIAGVDITNLTDHQIDSLREIQKAQEKARKKAEKEKRKKERKARRKARRNSVPQISDAERVAGRLLTMVKRTAINYSEQSGTVLPGYLDSTRFLGMNDRSGFQPGFDFVFGYQPGRAWLDEKATEGKLSRDSLFNSQFQQQYSQNIAIQTTVEPIPDLRIDLNWQQTFSKSHSELFKDTGTGFRHLSPYESGAFNITTITLKTMFQESGPGSGPFQQFLDSRATISRRLGNSNPYTNGTLDPNDPNYTKGYTGYAQDVLVPAFIAAYSGKSPENVPLIDYGNTTDIRHNPFRYYIPLPNWKITYTGLSKIPFIQERMTNLVVNHGYDSRLSMNSFSSSLYYLDEFNLGYPSFIDSNSGNYVPYFQVPNLTITEQFAPLIGFDASFRNNLTIRFEYRKTRTASLSLIDYQVSETKSTDYTFGLGYRIKGLTLPFEILGVRRLKNDLNIKVDIGLRDDRTTNNYLAQKVDITTRGQKVITISPSIDYIVNERLTLRFFYDRRQSIPYVSSSFPITTTKAGLTLRFIFAQ